MDILIVGGGSAGWIAASHMAVESGRAGHTVTLIESPNIPTIGVGEGTVPAIKRSLTRFGIKESTILSGCEGTYKQGIKFVNWHGDNSSYIHPFDYPFQGDRDLIDCWLGDDQTFEQVAGTQYIAIENKLAPKRSMTDCFEGDHEYAFHFDAAKFAKILSENAIEKLGVQHLFADVISVVLKPCGDVGQIITDKGIFEADLYIDCTGSQALIASQVEGAAFVDKSSTLFADRALAVQVQAVDSPIESATIATATEAGWIWDIGLQARRGIGHVYSSRHLSEEKARKILNEYVGKPVDARLIEMEVGYRPNSWNKNTVAIGMSQGFVEPLEATGLLVFDASARMLSEVLPVAREQFDLVAKQYNETLCDIWEGVIDFIKLHYVLSKREDSKFWKDNRHTATVPRSLQEKLQRWCYVPPTQYDFGKKSQVFHLENYLYVLYGMKYVTQPSATYKRHANDRRYSELKNYIADKSLNTKTLPSQRQYIERRIK